MTIWPCWPSRGNGVHKWSSILVSLPMFSQLSTQQSINSWLDNTVKHKTSTKYKTYSIAIPGKTFSSDYTVWNQLVQHHLNVQSYLWRVNGGEKSKGTKRENCPTSAILEFSRLPHKGWSKVHSQSKSYLHSNWSYNARLNIRFEKESTVF